MNGRNRSIYLPRTIGSLYCLLAFAGSFPLYVRSRLLAADDPDATIESILAAETLFRLGVVSKLAVGLIWGAIAFSLHSLLRPLRSDLATLFLVMVAIGVATQHANLIHLSSLLDAATGAIANATAHSARDAIMLFHHGERVWAFWAGAWLIPLGVLLLRSKLIPKFFAIGLSLASLGYIAPITAYYLAPELGESLRPLIVPAGLMELSFGGWLLLKGVDRTRYAKMIAA
jgi:hypothetical protein